MNQLINWEPIHSFEDPVGGIFDKGMHLIYETCIEEADKILRECMEDDEWIFLNGNYKDIAEYITLNQIINLLT